LSCFGLQSKKDVKDDELRKKRRGLRKRRSLNGQVLMSAMSQTARTPEDGCVEEKAKKKRLAHFVEEGGRKKKRVKYTCATV